MRGRRRVESSILNLLLVVLRGPGTAYQHGTGHSPLYQEQVACQLGGNKAQLVIRKYRAASQRHERGGGDKSSICDELWAYGRDRGAPTLRRRSQCGPAAWDHPALEAARSQTHPSSCCNVAPGRRKPFRERRL